MESMRAAVQADDHVVSPLTADSSEGSCFRSTLHKRTFYLLRIAKQNQLRESTLEPDCLGSEPTRLRHLLAVSRRSSFTLLQVSYL